MRTVSISILTPDAWTDEELYEREMHRADNRIDRHIQLQKFNPIEIIMNWVEKDAARIALRGVTTYSATSGHRNELRFANENPESPWYGIGQKYYQEYCQKLALKVHILNPHRNLLPSAFPSWNG